MRNVKIWLRNLAMLPAAALPLLPSATCPFCLAAYAGALSAFGLGFLFNARVQPPLILIFLALGIISVAWSTRSLRRPIPLVVSLVGSAGVVLGRLIWNLPSVLYTGVGLLVTASLWNLWLKRLRWAPIVQIRAKSAKGEGSGV